MRASTYSLLVCFVFVACGDGDAGPDSATDGGGSDARPIVDGGADTLAADASVADGAVVDTAVDTTPTPSCTATLGPGLTEEVLEHDGMTRTYHLMIPSLFDGSSPLPLVFDIHGYTENATRENSRTDMQALGEEEGFIVVQPEGTGALKSWNAGRCCGTAASSGVDDVGFIRAIVDDVSERACVDASRVYSTGLSNGGFLSHRLACEASDVFAAVAPVAAVLGVDAESCTPDRGVGVMHVNGTADGLVPYLGNPFVGYPSVMETLSDRQTTCQTWSECRDDAEVVLCTVEGGGHEWPPDSSGLQTSEEIWRFFSRHTR
jgi:polyhydroxybutyrate depolymerase